MELERLNHLKAIVNLDYENRHDNPQMYFTWEDLKWLVAQAEKAEQYKKEKKMYGDWVNKLQCKNDELKHRLSILKE